jgi:DNA repair exonuclease SbcCD ATPase subunit
VWVIVGIVAVGLIVWWVAAAVDGGEDKVATADVTQEDQIFENGDDSVLLPEDEQAPGSGTVLGGTPTIQPQIQGEENEEIEQFTQWSQRQVEVDEQYATEGLQELSGAIGAIIARYNEQPSAGEQAGGGPTGEESQQMQRHQQALQQTIERLEQAQQAQQSQVFHEAANTAAQTLQNIQRQAELTELDESVEALQQRVHQIQVDQPISQQSEQVRAYFDQSAKVVEQMSQSLQGAQTGGGPAQDNQQGVGQ